MSDTYSLRWNDFHSNLLTHFKSIKETEDLADVTIACENGETIKAHKLILSASSPFFRRVLKDNPCPHPIIILKDVTSTQMNSLLNFMYNGEVQISRDGLNDFLQTAQSLQVKGLTDVARQQDDSQPEPPTELDLTKKPEMELGSDASNSTTILERALQVDEDSMKSDEYQYPFGALHLPGPSTSPDNSRARVRATDPRPCPKCCKIYRSAHTLRTHLEDKHTICPGYRCVLCGTVAKSRNSLHSHMSRQHRGISTKDLPVVPMPAPFDPKLASRLLSKAGVKFEEGGSDPTYQQTSDTTGSAILDTYLQFIAENSLIGSMYNNKVDGDKPID